MNKSRDRAGTLSGEAVAPMHRSSAVPNAAVSVSSGPEEGRDEDGAATAPEGASGRSWDHVQKTWRRFASILGSARRRDEEPPFSDD